MQYEIINPSDPVTIVADDDMVAALATLIVGEGKLGLRSEADEEVLPLLIFGVEKWLASKGLSLDTLGEELQRRKDQIAACLATAMIGDFKDRASYEKGLELLADDPDKQAQWLEHYNDKRRSSMNDIVRLCHDISRAFREQAGKDRA